MGSMELARKLLELTAKHECHDLWWRTDGEYAPVTFMFNVNDVYFWACADAEEVTEENFPILEKAFEDCANTKLEMGIDATNYADLVFSARVRKMRPQNACYANYPEEIWPLLDACGPERPPDFGNPWTRERAATVRAERKDMWKKKFAACPQCNGKGKIVKEE